jgi:hypothetical protein
LQLYRFAIVRPLRNRLSPTLAALLAMTMAVMDEDPSTFPFLTPRVLLTCMPLGTLYFYAVLDSPPHILDLLGHLALPHTSTVSRRWTSTTTAARTALLRPAPKRSQTNTRTISMKHRLSTTDFLILMPGKAMKSERSS